jgi:hypothetical protein
VHRTRKQQAGQANATHHVDEEEGPGEVQGPAVLPLQVVHRDGRAPCYQPARPAHHPGPVPQRRRLAPLLVPLDLLVPAAAIVVVVVPAPLQVVIGRQGRFPTEKAPLILTEPLGAAPPPPEPLVRPATAPAGAAAQPQGGLEGGAAIVLLLKLLLIGGAVVVVGVFEQGRGGGWRAEGCGGWQPGLTQIHGRHGHPPFLCHHPLRQPRSRDEEILEIRIDEDPVSIADWGVVGGGVGREHVSVMHAVVASASDQTLTVCRVSCVSCVLI